MFYYLGIDIGGKNNTWALSCKSINPKKAIIEGELSIKETPQSVSPFELINFVQQRKVLITAIDAPLSFSLNNPSGLREADKVLKKMLPKEAKKWVLSYHSLMGIPLRGYFLAKAISPYCGAIIETHPRANFYFILPENRKQLAFKYKKEGLQPSEIKWLVEFLEKLFNLKIPEILFTHEGLIDALFCLLPAILYITNHQKLFFLPQENNLEGFGPFIVIREEKNL